MSAAANIESNPSGSPAPQATAAPAAVATPASAAPPSPASPWAGLPADIASHPSMAKFKDHGALAKSYLELEHLLGSEKLALPKEDAKPEEWARVWDRLGRPAKPEEYALGELVAAENQPIDEQLVGTMSGVFHEAGLSGKQAKAVTEAFINWQKSQFETHGTNTAQANEAAVTDLKREWGAAFPAELDKAQRALRLAAGDAYAEIAETPLANGVLLGNHPPIVRMLAKIGASLGEHSLKGEKTTAGRFTMTPAEALEALNELEASPILRDRNDPRREALMAKRDSLARMAYPNP